VTETGRSRRPPAAVDWVAVLLGVIGSVGAVIALLEGAWLWAVTFFVGSIVVELLVVLARRRRARRALGA
jgi:uncharacterized membrane protein YjjP (DUF1212 family)